MKAHNGCYCHRDFTYLIGDPYVDIKYIGTRLLDWDLSPDVRRFYIKVLKAIVKDL